MKWLMAMAMVLGVALQMMAASVSIVQVKQRYPWNGMVDIDYEITGDASNCQLEITVEDKESGQTYIPTKFYSTLPVTAGKHRVTWSTEAEGVSIVSKNVAFKLSLVQVNTPSTPSTPTNLYYVIDLSGGASATSYPVTTLSAPPAGGWTDEYKTTKLVLRRIEAGSFTHDGGWEQTSVTLTKPFYIGVFEVTQKQYQLVMGSNPSGYKGDARPVEYVSWNTIRGVSDTYNWPNVTTVSSTSFMGKLRAKAGLTVDLPTEAQWEYACRAGTTSSYNNGGNSESDLAHLGRYGGNINDGRGDYSQHTTVGSYVPNAWGLYDMHGNVREWCLDWHGGSLTGTDPVGPASGLYYRVIRGGDWGTEAFGCSSSSRSYIVGFYLSSGRNFCGFRLACSAGL